MAASMTWAQVAGIYGKKAAAAKPPQQWVWIVITLFATFIAGFLIDRQISKAALDKLELELDKKRADELAIMAKAAATEAAAEEMLKQSARILADIAQKEKELADRRLALDIEKKTLADAASWKDLGNV